MTKNDQIMQRYDEFLADRKNHDVEAQIAEAGHIVHEIAKVDSQKAFRQIQRQINSKSQIRLMNFLTRAAAILFIPLFITSMVFFYKLRTQSDTEQFAMHKISNPPGVRSEVVLPDGSKVWLNAESTISYRIPFDRNERNVSLVGEAFFDVQKDAKKPFQVESGKISVTVLGTRFNYKAFPEDTVIEVVLEEGKVKLNSIATKSKKEIILKPGERAVVNKTTYQTLLSSEDINKYVGWHDGKLIFDECPLPEVARRLERWFGIEVEIADPAIMDYQISTTFENESLHQILALLELASPIKTELIPATIEKTTQTVNQEMLVITSKK